MDNQKHTPGPWNVTNTAPSNALDIAIIFDAQSQVVCSVPKGSSNVPMLERRANARLIAAAPELLEACLAMIEWDAREEDHAVDFYARMALCGAAFDKARAAIAAATGSSHG